MIGLDTNILVRYFVQDDIAQSKLATRLIETQCTVTQPGLISLVVLCELVWVFESAYQYEKSLICKLLQRLLMTAEFEIEPLLPVRAALKEYQGGNADFADCLIQHLNHASGCDYTFTFDRKAAKSQYGRLLRRE
ncbi:MAG: type II toxin-antitoxin system VapC family toxin [Pseudomonadales bacterium]|nr:type II toxin-antitoxin system VapC family toxin [Pseudomonadales bacterium]